MRQNNLRFNFLTGDCNWQEYGGTFISERTFTQSDWPFRAIIRFDNLEENMHDAPAKYLVSVEAVSIQAAGQELEEALKMQGAPDMFHKDCSDILKYEALVSYGVTATLWSKQGNNIEKLMREAHEQATILCGMFFGFAMDRVANGFGNTGWDFISGQIGYGHHYEDIHPEVES